MAITEDTVYIRYNNETVNSITKGQTCTLQCKTPTGKATQMLSDIDVEFVAGSGGESGVELYTIDIEYDVSAYYPISAPTTIAKGQIVTLAVMISNDDATESYSNCELVRKDKISASLYPHVGSGYILIYEISNPTDDINITLTASGGN